jgi:hypothetical protein
MWQRALQETDKQNYKYMENRYKTLNKKLDEIKKTTHPRNIHNTPKKLERKQK